MKGISGQTFLIFISFALAAVGGCSLNVQQSQTDELRHHMASLPDLAELDRLTNAAGTDSIFADLSAPLLQLNASYNEGVLLLNAPEQQLAYAVFGFLAGDSTLLSLTVDADSGLWLLAANYSTGQWNSASPISLDGGQLTLDAETDWISSSGFVYAAVVAAPEAAGQLRDLWLESIDPLHEPTIYYVATDGSDTNEGSADLPWETLQHAADNLQPGDSAIVRPGQYASFRAEIIATEALPCSFVAEPGARILFSKSEYNQGVTLNNCAFVSIEGFEISGAFQSSVLCTNSTNIRINRNMCSGSSSSAFDIKASDNVTLHWNATSYINSGNSCSIIGKCANAEIHSNEFENASGICIDIRSGVFSGNLGSPENVTIDNNFLIDSSPVVQGVIVLRGTKTTQIHNNLFIFKSGRAITIDNSGENILSNNTYILHNSFIGGETARSCVRLLEGCGDISLYNNIFAGPAEMATLELDESLIPNVTSNNNAMLDLIRNGIFDIDLAEWRELSGQDMQSSIVTIETVFQDYSAEDYRPAGSAVDTALAEFAPKADMLGNPRPFGLGYDCGCLELLENPID